MTSVLPNNRWQFKRNLLERHVTHPRSERRGLSKIEKSEKHKNLKDKTKVTNKDAKKDEQKISIKNREAGAYRIQLASLGKRQAAEKFLKKVRTKNATLLGGMKGRVMKINLKSRGIFYRVQGDLSSREQAEKKCEILRSRKQACLVVRN